MFPSTPLGQRENYYLLNLNEYIINELFLVGCFLLGTIIILILCMSNNSRHNDRFVTGTETNESDNSETPRLHNKLLAQVIHNQNTRQPLTYNNFPSGHLGYLNLEERTRLVSLMRSSCMADQFRYGSSIGTFYIKGTHRYPITSPEMVGVVMSLTSVPQ